MGEERADGQEHEDEEDESHVAERAVAEVAPAAPRRTGQMSSDLGDAYGFSSASSTRAAAAGSCGGAFLASPAALGESGADGKSAAASAVWPLSPIASGRSRVASARRVKSRSISARARAVIAAQSQLTACTPLPEIRDSARRRRGVRPAAGRGIRLVEELPDSGSNPRREGPHDDDAQVHQGINGGIAHRTGLLVGELLDARVANRLQDAAAAGDDQQAENDDGGGRGGAWPLGGEAIDDAADCRDRQRSGDCPPQPERLDHAPQTEHGQRNEHREQADGDACACVAPAEVLAEVVRHQRKNAEIGD